MSNAPLPPDPLQPLPYASRIDTALLMQVYSYVGWYMLLSSIVGVVNVVMNVAIAAMSGMVASSMRMQSIYAIPMTISAIGGIGLISRRPWGAHVMIVGAALRILIACSSILMAVAQSQAMAAYYSLNNAISQAAQAAVTGVFVYFLLKLCKDNQAFAA